MNPINFYPSDIAELGALVLFLVVGGVSFGRLVIFGVIDTLAIWANAYYGRPKPNSGRPAKAFKYR